MAGIDTPQTSWADRGVEVVEDRVVGDDGGTGLVVDVFGGESVYKVCPGDRGHIDDEAGLELGLKLNGRSFGCFLLSRLAGERDVG